jgi:hypothetical protein
MNTADFCYILIIAHHGTMLKLRELEQRYGIKVNMRISCPDDALQAAQEHISPESVSAQAARVIGGVSKYEAAL